MEKRKNRVYLSKEKKLQIGKAVHEHELTYEEAMKKYDISFPSVSNCVRDYRVSIGVLRIRPRFNEKETSTIRENNIELDYLNNLSKEQLIDEVIKAKIGEARAKKGYKVRGGGRSKEFVTTLKENTK